MLNNFLKRFIKKIFLIILIFQFAFFQFPLPTVMAAAGSQTLTSQADFEAGTLGSGLSSSQTPGDLRLDYQTSIRADTTAENFNLGNTFQDTYTTRVKNDSGGEVVINPVYNYNQYSSPVLDSGYVKNSFLDEARNLLYVSTNGGGLSVINTQGTIDPSDDTLVKTYTTATTPAIGNNYVDHSFLDSTHNLIYVSTGGGLSVINTQGTIDPADDTLIKTYTTATTPAIANNIVLDSFLDSTHNLIYVSTWGGLSAINTQGTIDPADDTLIKTYTTATTPAIGNNYVYHSFLDSAHNLIYVSTSGGGLSVINTQGTIDPADDTLVKTYTTATTPAIANNIVLDSFLDSTHNLIYVSTSSGGLSVINTQGTIDPADDTLVKTYTTATTPAIGNNYVLDSFLDSTHNLIYVSTGGGLSVINTQGTIDPADDTLVKTYTTATTPAIGNNIVRHSFFDSTHNLIYVSTRRGLSVINLNNTYNTQGVYTKDVDRNSVNLWQTKTAIPTARFSAATGVISEKIYVAGGVNRDTFNILEAYDPVTNTWSTKASMSTGRNSSVSGVINGKLYVAGGKDTDYNALSSLEIYDPATDTWSAGPAMSTKRIGAVGDVYNGKLYVMGGMTGACNNNSEQSMEVYDPDTDTWSTLAPAPIVKSTSGTAKFINGKMYVAGGQNWCDITFSNSLIVYDPATNTWDSAKAPMPYGRAGGTSAVVDGKFLYIGGTNDDWDSVNDIFIYDLVTDSWGIYSTLPDVLHRPMANVIDNNLYVAGGRNSDWDQVDTNYLLSSDFLSDSYQKETYSKISWTATTPDGTSVEMLYSLNSGQTYESLGATQGTYYLPADSSAYSLRYKAILSTDDVSVTPSLDSVTVYYATENSGLYPSSEIYTSKVIDATRTSDWQDLDVESTTPEGTSITYQTRSGRTMVPDGTWSDWADVTDNAIASPDARYLQIKATLATTDENVTPTISAITINYDMLELREVEDPDITKMGDEFSQGFITIEGDDPTATESFTLNADYIFSNNNSTVEIPTGTIITQTGGEDIDLTQFTTEDNTLEIKDENGNTLGSIRIGIPDMRLTFSNPITVSIYVGDEYNGNTLSVFYRLENDTNWNNETTCTVSNGLCTFQTSHTTTFRAEGNNDEEEQVENAHIDSWTAEEYENPNAKCTQRLKLTLKGKHFDKNATVKIGNKEASSVERKDKNKLVAKFCLEKLLNVKTDLERNITVTNPDADRKKAKKEINLGDFINSTNITNTSNNSEYIKSIQKKLVELNLLEAKYITGIYGPITTEAVRKFQEQNGIEQTGFVGPITKGKLGM